MKVMWFVCFFLCVFFFLLLLFFFFFVFFLFVFLFFVVVFCLFVVCCFVFCCCFFVVVVFFIKRVILICGYVQRISQVIKFNSKYSHFSLLGLLTFPLVRLWLIILITALIMLFGGVA